MKCSNCGEPIEEGRLFCLKCGQEVQWVPDYDSFGSLMEQERIKKEKKEREEADAARKKAAAAAELRRKKKEKTNDYSDFFRNHSCIGDHFCISNEASDG